ncbi:putative ribonuclease H-like domain-containing protein [Tanacetum coccineum]
MTDYSLWEVINNGNKVLRRTVGTIKQEYKPTTAEEKQDRRNEMKARMQVANGAPPLKGKGMREQETRKVTKKYQSVRGSRRCEFNQEDMTNLKLLRSLPSDGRLHALILRTRCTTHTQEDLEKLYPDDLEEMDLQWEMAMLTIRARRFIKRTGKKLDINGQRVGFDKLKMECYNCHKHGHFARECRFPRNQKNKGRENNTRTIAVETPTQNVLIAQDGIGGYDWSYQAEEEQPINHALMAFISSGSSSSSYSEVDSCSKTCVKAYASLKEQYDSLSSDYKKSQFNLVSYKAGLGYDAATVASPAVECFVNLNWIGLDQYGIINSSSPLSGNFIPRKPDITFTDEIVKSENLDVTTVVTPWKKLNTAGAAVNTVKTVNTANTKAVNTVRLVNTAASNQLVKHTTDRDRAVVSENKGKWANAVKALACWGNPQQKEYKENGVIDSGCSRHMTGNKCYLDEYEDYDGGFVSFGDGKGRISSKGKIKTGSLDFDDVYFCQELKYNLFSVLQICDKKNNVLFTDTECLVLSSNFKLLDESQVLLRVPRKDNIYSVDLKSVVPTGGLTCLIAKAIIDESNTWHRRLGHINFKTMNKLVKGNLIKGLPSKIFENDHSCVACQKGKQHKASYKTKLVNSISKPLHMLHMDLFGPTNVKSLMKKVLVIKPYNKTPYELIHGRPPLIDFMKPFGCLVTILNTRDHLGKFDGKADEGYFVGYSVVSKAMRVFNKRRRIVKETLNIRFFENTTNVKGYGPDWLFDVDSLTISMNYVPVVAGKKTNGIAGTKDNIVAGQSQKEKELEQEYILIPLCTTDPLISQGPKDCEGDAGMKPTEVDENEASDKSGKHNQKARSELERLNKKEMQTEHTNSSNGINTVSTPVSTAGPSFDTVVPSTPVNTVGPSVSTANESEEQLFERFSPFKNAFTLPPVPNVSSMDNTGIFGNAYDDEDLEEEVDMNNVISSYSVPDTSFTKFHKDHPEDQVIGSLKTPVQTRHMTKITKEHVQALKDPSWVEAIQDELLQFKLLKVWTLVDLPRDKWAIGTKRVFRNKKDERGIVVKNKARLVAQGHTQEEVYQMDVKNAFLYGKIEEEVYVCQPLSCKDPHFPDKVYKVDKALYGLHQAPRAWYETLSTYLLDNGFHKGQIDKTLFIKKHKDDILLVKQKSDGIFISQDKYVAEILKKFDFASVKTASIPMEINKALIKDEASEDVDVHLYRSMIRSLMYLTASRPDIMFVVYACARDSPFDLEAFCNSDYARASLDRKSTIGGCQFLGKRLISWQCKKQTIVANSITEVEYVAAANCCGHNLVFHSKTKHIEIRHHFIRDSYEKKLIQVIKIHTDQNVADLLTKAFDASRQIKRGQDTKIPQSGGPPKNFGDEAVHKELGDRMERAATTASSLEAEQDSGCQDTILGDVDAQTRFETTSKQFNDQPLSKVNTFGSGEDNMQLMELMAHCTILCAFVSIKEKRDVLDEVSTTKDVVRAITATIDGRDKIITEASIRRHLKLQDSEGLTSLPNGEIFEQLTRMGFIQILLNKQQRLLLPHTRTYSTPTLTNKLFNNMRRASKGYSGVVTPLFDTMLVQPQDEAPSTSPSRITSSPSLSSHHTTSSTLTTPPSIQTIHEAEEPITMPP